MGMGRLMRKFTYCCMVSFSFRMIAIADPATGSISGRISLPARPESRIPVEKYVGSISGKVAPPPRLIAGVWIEGPGLTAPASSTPVKLSQLGYQFASSLMIVPRGTTVIFPNEDADYHNVFSLSRSARFDLGRYKKEDSEVPRYTFNTCGLVRIKCEIHEHMKANVLVVDSPHFTTTDGNFSLNHLPAGTWTLRVQLDEKTQWHAIVKVGKGKSTVETFILGPPPAPLKL
jgi:plastocyanin